MDEAPIPLLIALSVLLALAVGCIIYLITRIQALKQRVSEADIRQMVDMGEETGEIEKEERELIENVFEFNNSTAAEVMIHRTDVVMLWAEDPDEEIMKTIRDSGLTRFPVYEEDTDDIIGILNTRDYLLNAREERPKPLRKLLRKAYFVPETVRTDVLFRDMQSRKTHFAVVVDEYGGTSGIITMEDLIEELVGNIYDEFDPQDEQEIIPLKEGLWRIHDPERLPSDIGGIVGHGSRHYRGSQRDALHDGYHIVILLGRDQKRPGRRDERQQFFVGKLSVKRHIFLQPQPAHKLSEGHFLLPFPDNMQRVCPIPRLHKISESLYGMRNLFTGNQL